MQVSSSSINNLSQFLFFLCLYSWGNTHQTTMAVHLRVILEEHNIQKLKLPTGIPNTMEDLVTETFQLYGEIGLLYQDKHFDNEFFSVTSTADLYDKATVKVILKEPTITLDLHPVLESSTLSSVSTYPARTTETDICPYASSSSSDTIILPDSCRSAAWPVPFQVPEFSRDLELILAEANNSYDATGRHFMDASVKSAIMQELAKVIFSYTAYPTNEQILSVAEALVSKFPCLREPWSYAGLYGWQQRIKNKMHNYRAKLRSRKYSYPEIEINTLKRKHPGDTVPSKNIKSPKKQRLITSLRTLLVKAKRLWRKRGLN